MPRGVPLQRPEEEDVGRVGLQPAPVDWGAVRDEWETPPLLFKQLELEFGPFELDACASEDNHLAKKWYDKEDDGLACGWYGRVYMNPPYSQWRHWCKKALHEVTRGGATLVVGLLPADTSTAAFHDYVLGKAEVRFLRGRQRFYYRHQPGPSRPRFASMVVVWRRLTGV